MNRGGAVRADCRTRDGTSREASVKLTENEDRALKELRKTVTSEYPVIDMRLYGSKARGDADPDSDLDVMIEIADCSPQIMADIDDMVYRINLEHDVLISTLIFGRTELENGPMSESPIYKVIQREGIPLRNN